MKSSGTVVWAPNRISTEEHLRSSLGGCIQKPSNTHSSASNQFGPLSHGWRSNSSVGEIILSSHLPGDYCMCSCVVLLEAQKFHYGTCVDHILDVNCEHLSNV